MEDIITTTEEFNELQKPEIEDDEDWEWVPVEHSILTNREIKNLQQNIKLALSEAVGILYLADSADYKTSLWKIVEYLGGQDAVRLLECDEHRAFLKYCRDELNGEESL